MNLDNLRADLRRLVAEGSAQPDIDIDSTARDLRDVVTDASQNGFQVTSLRQVNEYGLVSAIGTDKRGEPILVLARLRGAARAANALYRTATALSRSTDRRAGELRLRAFGKNPKPSYLVTSYFPEAKRLTNLTGSSLEPGLVFVCRALVEQVVALHSAGVAHGDIKPQNIVIDEMGDVHLIDFEYALVEDLDPKYIEFGGTYGYVHPDRVAAGTRGDTTVEIATAIEWDLYSLGRTLIALADAYHCDHAQWPALYIYRYLRLLGCRLLGSVRKSSETVLGIPAQWFDQFPVRSADEALDALERLDDRNYFASRVPELDTYGQEQIAASQYVKTVNSFRLQRVLATHEMTRLASLQQLGLLSTVFPAATHTRHVHAIGVYAMVCEYLRYTLSDHTNPFLRQVATPAHIKATMLAALLHDIGHFPLAHDLEESVPQVFNHEARTESILQNPTPELNEAMRDAAPLGWSLDPEEVRRVLHPNGSILHRLLQSFISGPLDADKLDYLTRDSATIGVRFGKGLDVRFLLTELTPIIAPGGAPDKIYIGTSEKGSIAAAAVADIRYRMYARVYWHHAYREVKAMIHLLTANLLVASPSADQTGIPALSDLATLTSQQCAAMERTLRYAVAEYLGDTKAPATLAVAPPVVLPEGVRQWEVRPEHHILFALSQAGSPESQRLSKLIFERKYFKRIHALSRGISLDDKLVKLFERLLSTGPRSWLARLRLSLSFQHRVVERVMSSRRAENQTTTLFASADKEHFIAAARSQYVVAVDFPDMTRAPAKDLWFVREESKILGRAVQHTPPQYRDSNDYRRTAENFSDLAKVRIMADRRFADYLRGYLSDEGLEADLYAALQEILMV